MRLSPLKICIIDDVDSYFNEEMLSLARNSYPIHFERWSSIGHNELNDLTLHPRDIVILDIKGIIKDNIGKDGFDVSKHLMNNTRSFVAITSAHKFQLQNKNVYGDYVLTERLMTPIDFVDELNSMISLYLSRKQKVYQKIFYKIGFKLLKANLN